MATIRGGGGDVTLPSGFNAKLNSFNVTITVGEVNTTGFEDVGWEVMEPTCLSLSGSCEGVLIFDVASSAPVPDGLIGATPDTELAIGTITLTFATGCTWTFNGNINNFNLTRSGGCQGEGRITYGFNHAGGGVAQVWDETP